MAVDVERLYSHFLPRVGFDVPTMVTVNELCILEYNAVYSGDRRYVFPKRRLTFTRLRRALNLG
jgi:hypothetical protein